jgi:hypothetical protein
MDQWSPQQMADWTTTLGLPPDAAEVAENVLGRLGGAGLMELSDKRVLMKALREQGGAARVADGGWRGVAEKIIEQRDAMINLSARDSARDSPPPVAVSVDDDDDDDILVDMLVAGCDSDPDFEAMLAADLSSLSEGVPPSVAGALGDSGSVASPAVDAGESELALEHEPDAQLASEPEPEPEQEQEPTLDMDVDAELPGPAPEIEAGPTLEREQEDTGTIADAIVKAVALDGPDVDKNARLDQELRKARNAGMPESMITRVLAMATSDAGGGGGGGSVVPPELEPELELELEPEPEPEPEPELELDAILPTRVRLAHVHEVLSVMGTTTYYVLDCTDADGKQWQCLKLFDAFIQLREAMATLKEEQVPLSAPFPSKAGLIEQQLRTTAAAARWVRDCIDAPAAAAAAAVEPQEGTDKNPPFLVPWAEGAEGAWAWADARFKVWSSRRPLGEIATELEAAAETQRPVLLRTFGSSRLVAGGREAEGEGGSDGSATATATATAIATTTATAPVAETQLPVWCTWVLGLAEEQWHNESRFSGVRSLRAFYARSDALLAVLALENQVSTQLLSSCGGLLKHGGMEKEGQVNTQFQGRHFALWPHEPCRLQGHTFRLLFYFDSPGASKAKGCILIEKNPGLLDLTRERNGEFVRRIFPAGPDGQQEEGQQEPSSAAAGEPGLPGPSLASLLGQHCKRPPEARALTLRWADYTSMEEWSDAFGGHYLEEPPAPPDAGSQAKAVELLGRLTLATASTLTSLVGATEDMEEDAEDAAARAEAEAVRQRERAEQDDRDVFAAAEQALVVQHGQNH